MGEVWQWMRERWYWVVGAILGLLLVYLYLKNRSDSTAPTTASTDTSATDASTLAAEYNADATAASANAQLQTAQVQAQSAAQQTAQAAAAQVQIAQLQLQQQQDVDATNLGIATSGNNASVALANSNNAAAVQIAGLQYGSVNTQANDALTLGQYNDDTQVALQNGIDATNYATTLSNNQTALSEYTIQGQVANNAITTAGQVDDATTAAQLAATQAYYGAATQISNNQTQAQQNMFNTAASIISSGQLNKGGEGGTIQQTAFASLVGAQGAAQTSAAASGNVGVAQAQQTAATVTSVMNGLAKVGGAVLA